MTRTVLVAGTASHVGKSTVAAGLCRLLADRGYDVVPFKAQNMSNNARAVPTPQGEFGEIGVSQYTQARGAGLPATTDMNPVLLKPRGEGQSQIVIDGLAREHASAGVYYERHWEYARGAAHRAWKRLAERHEIVIAEGAGSIAEINLHDRDLANVETARFADAEILLLVDIERGGAFASLYGTIELLPADLRERVVGALITKFRGDRSILDPGIETIEERTGVPVLGVLPYSDPGLPAEDSLSLPPAGERTVCGANDGVSAERSVTICVPRLPHVSNFDDLDPLAREPGVRVTYLPLDTAGGVSTHEEIAAADAVVIPGTKNTVDDLLALSEHGFDEALDRFDGPIVGLCGGYQMLGERLTNANREGTDSTTEITGLGVLPVETRFAAEKTVRPVSRKLNGCGPLAGADGTVRGYEIHHGHTELVGRANRPFENSGAATERAVGTYLHGLFENRIAREAFLDRVFAVAERSRPGSEAAADQRDPPLDQAASLLAEHVDLGTLGF